MRHMPGELWAALCVDDGWAALCGDDGARARGAVGRTVW